MPAPFKLLVIADLSGRASQDVCEPESLGARPFRRIDKDSFDEVFSRLKVQLRFAFDESPVHFDDIDALHPDHLVEHLSVFARYRQLQRQLKKPEGAHLVAQALGFQNEQAKASPKPSDAPTETQDNLLDSVLNASAGADQADKHSRDLGSDPFGIAALIQTAVAPHIVNQPDPRTDTLKALLDSAMSDTLRGILHTRAFRQLESSWLAIDFLNRRLDTDRACHLYVFDASAAEIRADLAVAGNDITASAVHKKLVEDMAVPGEQNFDAVLFDYRCEANEADLTLIAGLAKVAQAGGISLLLNGSEQLAGSTNLLEDADPSSWQDPRADALKAQLLALRAGLFERVYLCGPRFLQRLPYGKRSAPIESFDFEELSSLSARQDHLWGGGATLLAFLLIEHYTATGAKSRLGEGRYINDLPLYVSQDEDGDAEPLPCAEVVLTDKAADALEAEGLCVLRSVKHQNRIQIPYARPFSSIIN